MCYTCLIWLFYFSLSLLTEVGDMKGRTIPPLSVPRSNVSLSTALSPHCLLHYSNSLKLYL